MLSFGVPVILTALAFAGAFLMPAQWPVFAAPLILWALFVGVTLTTKGATDELG